MPCLSLRHKNDRPVFLIPFSVKDHVESVWDGKMVEKQHRLINLVQMSVKRRARLLFFLVNGVLIGLWLWLYRPLFDYLTIIFSRDDFRTNQIVLVGVIVLIVVRVRKEAFHLQLDRLPQLHLPALGLVLSGSVLYLLVERFLDINTVSASLFGFASYEGCTHRR